MGVHGKMVSDRVLNDRFGHEIGPRRSTVTHLYDLEKLLWAIHAPNGKSVQQLH
jgi:hypothetical protein